MEKLPAAFKFVQLFLLKKRSLKSCATKHLSLQGEVIKDSLWGWQEGNLGTSQAVSVIHASLAFIIQQCTLHSLSFSRFMLLLFV